MKILLLGADGQVGHALRRSLAPLGEVITSTVSGRLPAMESPARDGRAFAEGPARGEVCEPADFTQPDTLAALIERIDPAWVVNAAAYTAVDKAEDEPELAQRINAEAVDVIARTCAARGTRLVHYSTDYVFAGDASRPYREDDLAGPLGVYGASKWAGEQAVRASGVSHLLFRLCWVYGAHGQNFLKTMLRLANERDVLRVVADQVGTPTPAAWIADATARAIQRQPNASGTWHLAAGGETSWCGFAEAIVEQAQARGLIAQRPRVEAITSADYPTRARRPRYSRLDTGKLARDFGIELPDWREGVREVIASLAAA